jgi:hypothetical protein
VSAAPRRRCEAVGKARERLGGDALDGDEPVLLEACDLAGEGVKLAVTGENARDRARRQRRQEASDEVVRVGRERDGAGVGQAEERGDAALHARHQRPEDHLPFGVGEPCRIGERPAVSGAGGVRPVMMAVRSEVDAPRRGGAELGEMTAQIEGHAGGLAV